MPPRSPRPSVRPHVLPRGRRPSWRTYVPAVAVVTFLMALAIGPTVSGAGQDAGTPPSGSGGHLLSRVAALETRVAALESLVGRPTASSGAATGGGQAAGGAEVTVEGVDIAWVYNGQRSAPGQPVIVTAAPGTTISLPNTGATLHNFAIDALGIDVDMPVGQTVTATIPADAPPGEYEFYCNVPGHKPAGMVGTMVISPPASTSAAAPVAAAPVAATPVAIVLTAPTEGVGGDVLSFDGVGPTALDPFDLPGGVYKFTVACDAGFFSVDVVPIGHEEHISVGLYGGAPYSGSDNVTFDGGRYAMSVDCGATWTVAIQPVR